MQLLSKDKVFNSSLDIMNPLKQCEFGWFYHEFDKGWWQLRISIGCFVIWFEWYKKWNEQFDENGNYKK